MRAYAESIISSDTFKAPFGNRELSIDDIYVPLKFEGELDTEQVDAIEAIEQFPRLMITGVPGSGKSKLLEYVSLQYAKHYFLKDRNQLRIPVLLQLSRFSDADKQAWSINKHIESILKDRKFKHVDSNC